jgi:hypothetical protein
LGSFDRLERSIVGFEAFPGIERAWSLLRDSGSRLLSLGPSGRSFGGELVLRKVIHLEDPLFFVLNIFNVPSLRARVSLLAKAYLHSLSAFLKSSDLVLVGVSFNIDIVESNGSKFVEFLAHRWVSGALDVKLIIVDLYFLLCYRDGHTQIDMSKVN